MRPRLGLFGRNAAFRDFWCARAVSYLGDAVAAVALVLYVYELRGSGTAVGLLLLASVVPQIGGPLAGALADRLAHRRLMIGADLGRFALFGVIALALPPFPALLGLVAAAAVLSTLFQPAGRSTLPALVAPGELTAANALLGTALNLSLALGPALGGLAIAALGTRGALAANACSFLLSAFFVARLPARAPAAGGPLGGERQTGAARGGVLGETWAGLAYLAGHPTARAVAVGLFLLVAFAGVDNVALVFLARDVLGAGQVGYGLVSAAFGVGMVLAPLAVLR